MQTDSYTYFKDQGLEGTAIRELIGTRPEWFGLVYSENNHIALVSHADKESVSFEGFTWLVRLLHGGDHIKRMVQFSRENYERHVDKNITENTAYDRLHGIRNEYEHLCK